jgi:prepilin-type processing-associated H-X9-DG protein
LPFCIENLVYVNYRPPEKVGKSDYAGNAGDLFARDTKFNEGPPSYTEADKEGDDKRKYWIDTSLMTGIFYQRSTTKTAEVTDGLSKTYLVGEKYADPAQYRARLVTAGDDQCMYVGADEDINRWAGHFLFHDLVPRRDTRNQEHDESFGSAHPSGCQFLFCDGSVRLVTYDIDGQTHRQQANRHDQELTP